MRKISWLAALVLVTLSAVVGAQKPDADAAKLADSPLPPSTRAMQRP